MDFEEMNRNVIAEFRANAGKVGGFFENMPLLLLHTTGAKSGAERVNPLAYLAEGDRFFVFASKAGAPDNPDWYYNVRANPEVSVEMGEETFPARAMVVDRAERDRVYGQMAARHENFAEYERQTTRTIPVVVLERTG